MEPDHDHTDDVIEVNVPSAVLWCVIGIGVGCVVSWAYVSYLRRQSVGRVVTAIQDVVKLVPFEATVPTTPNHRKQWSEVTVDETVASNVPQVP